jgi:hypothetical protein
MIEYILNGKTIKVKPEHEQHFLKNNPDATKKTSWWKGQEGLVPDELEFWKKPNQPGKSQEAGQPQQNQQVNTGSSSETGSSDSAEIYELNGKKISVAGIHKNHFLKNNPTAKKYEKTVSEKAKDTRDWWKCNHDTRVRPVRHCMYFFMCVSNQSNQPINQILGQTITRRKLSSDLVVSEKI